MSEDGDKRAKRLLSLTQQPAKFLATIQVGITLAGFLLSLMGSIPSGRQNIKLTYNNLKIKILKIGRRKIEDTLVQVTGTKKEA